MSNPNPNEPVPEWNPNPNEPVPGWNPNVQPGQRFRRDLMLNERISTDEVKDMMNANVKSVVHLLTRDDIHYLHDKLHFPTKPKQIKKEGGG